MWPFLIVSTLAWGFAELFYKKGNPSSEKYAHLKTTVFVGLFMGIYAIIILFTQGIDLVYFPLNFAIYLPVALCYILSMVMSYFGIRYLEESLADPIENSSIAIVPILSAIFLKQTFSIPVIVGIIIVVMGVIAISLLDRKGHQNRSTKLGKKLAIIAISMPIVYMLLDGVGTFLDIFYTKSVESTILVHVTSANLQHTANCCYEFAFLLVGIGCFIFLKAKKQKLFATNNVEIDRKNEHWYQKVLSQKWKLLAALFETIGQATYLFALSVGGAVAAVILGAGTVIISLILSRIFLKEKLSLLQYLFVLIILSGIIMLSILGV